ncbi:Spy/CpxP family protein refolding chaperone [Pseudomonas saliphila]|uniref:Spy/CpxP family protein refolding chaperone n=1 Tax=Pseudomonas saliphila TaxID=2586906 RepID=UPI00123A30D9|nr:periplasmic heavy metal sensor [Pseudomonas saliphila]
MRNLLIASVTAITLGLSGSVFAAQHKGGGEHKDRYMDRLTEELDLSAEQQEQFREIKKEQMEKHREIHEESKERMDEVLDEEQRERFDEFHEKNRDKMMKNYGDKKSMKSENN